MKKKIIKSLCITLMTLLILLGVTAIFIVNNVDFKQIKEMPDNTYVSFQDIESINKENMFGRLVKVELDKVNLEVGQHAPKSGNVVFKLFGIPIKKVDVQLLNDEKVFLGGNAVGFSIKTDGVIVIGKNSVLTEDGLVSVSEKKDIISGDIITHVNGVKLNKASDIPEIINSSDGVIKLSINRKNKSFDVDIDPVTDKSTGKKKIGLWVRDDATGIGTLTFVDEDDLEFGALGHPVTDGETGAKIDVQSGEVFSCSIVGVEKGEKGKPGEIKGVFLNTKSNKGVITSGGEFGIFGTITDKSGIVDENVFATIGGRMAVKPGRAQIVSSISGVREFYDIEIIKASKQKSAKDRSMVFRVVDKRLLELTGGIVQGMSGSPILQNGKLVGAVTHVFVSDPTKGYGIYIDWMKI